jgi:hypothetical protein
VCKRPRYVCDTYAISLIFLYKFSLPIFPASAHHHPRNYRIRPPGVSPQDLYTRHPTGWCSRTPPPDLPFASIVHCALEIERPHLALVKLFATRRAFAAPVLDQVFNALRTHLALALTQGSRDNDWCARAIEKEENPRAGNRAPCRSSHARMEGPCFCLLVRSGT